MRLCFVICLWLALIAPLSAQVIVTDLVCVADAFVRSVDPTHNYGAAGALAVSGLVATNVLGQQEGLLDSVMRFDASGAVSNFNSSLGAGRWVIVSATLNLFEQGAPNNTIFNRGVGPFGVRWVGTNLWAEGSGNPNAPTMDGIVWSNRTSVVTSNMDESLGTYTNGGVDGLVRLSLGTPSGFMSNLSSGTNLSFYLTTTTNSTVGFTFHSRNFVDPTQWPFLEIMAVPIPRITALAIVGPDVRIGFPMIGGMTNAVEYNNNLDGGSWSTLTNITGASGNVTVIDSGAAVLPKRFYRVGVVAP